MRNMWFVLSVCLLGFASASAQTVDTDRYSSEQLKDLTRTLHTQADASNGTATKILAQYPGHYTMLVYRDKSGEVEVHRQFTDILMVIDGKATLITSGTTQNGKEIKPGEIRGTAIEGGSKSALEKGDLVHISASVPHQVLVPTGGSITYIAVKIETPTH